MYVLPFHQVRSFQPPSVSIVILLIITVIRILSSRFLVNISFLLHIFCCLLNSSSVTPPYVCSSSLLPAALSLLLLSGAENKLNVFWFHNTANTICSFPGFLFAGRTDKQQRGVETGCGPDAGSVTVQTPGCTAGRTDGRSCCLCRDDLSLLWSYELVSWCRAASLQLAGSCRGCCQKNVPLSSTKCLFSVSFRALQSVKDLLFPAGQSPSSLEDLRALPFTVWIKLTNQLRGQEAAGRWT